MENVLLVDLILRMLGLYNFAKGQLTYFGKKVMKNVDIKKHHSSRKKWYYKSKIALHQCLFFMLNQNSHFVTTPRKQGIVNNLCKYIPSTRHVFWRDLPVAGQKSNEN